MKKTTKTTTEVPQEFTVSLLPEPDIAKSINNARKKIAKLTVESAEDCVEASKVLADVAKLRRITVKRYKEIKDPVLNASRAIDSNRNAALAMIATLEASVSALIRQFRETQAKAAAAIEEQQRKALEESAAQRKQEQIDQIRAAAEATNDANVRKLLEHQAGVVEKAHTIIEPIEPVAMPSTLADGVHEREHSHAAVDDFRKLVLQVAASIMLEDPFSDFALHNPDAETVYRFLQGFKPNAQSTIACLAPAMPHLNRLARNLPVDLALEGVRVEKDSSFVAR